MRQALIESAKQAFLRDGFMKASLREIAKRAGCTTGAIYTQFGSKQGLYKALVEETYQGLLDLMNEFSDRSKLAEVDPYQSGEENSMRILAYGYQHFDEFKLLITASKGTDYEDFLERLVDYDYQSALEYLAIKMPEQVDTLKSFEYEYRVFVRLTFQAMLMPFIDDMSESRANIYYQNVNKMFLSGWQALDIF